MQTYWITVTAHFGAVRVSAFDIAFGGGNTTGDKVATEVVPRYTTDENIVREFVSRHFGHKFDITPGDVRSLFIVNVY